MNGLPENVIYIGPERLAQLRELHRRRDEQAFIAGTALLGHEKRKEAILREFAGDEAIRNLRLGSVYYELLRITEDCLHRVTALSARETELGPQILREVGLDPTREELRVDMTTGAVLVLRAGAWVLREKEARA